jgi:hypothetical protein
MHLKTPTGGVQAVTETETITVSKRFAGNLHEMASSSRVPVAAPGFFAMAIGLALANIL